MSEMTQNIRNNRPLSGKRALITGSTSGIGLGIARVLAGEGCDVLLSGFGDPEAIEQLRQSFEREYGVAALFFAADLAHTEQCRNLAAHALGAWGRVDILINNAGIQHVAPVEEMPAERWDTILAINLSAAFHLIAALLPAMKATGFGRIVNIASVHGLVGSKDKTPYVAAKHGLVGLTKVVALEAAGRGVTVNAICPGFVATPLLQAQIDDRMAADGLSRPEAERALLSDKQPSGRFTEVQEIGAAVAFLCSGSAANLTGTSIPIDGGWTSQ